ncbi:AraC-like DNA-binding protein [Kribbella aluminosa]|uniref:AraC-like DNA-binding protein n=1 Tax=Kribbella aluminosa TaxID=416017 RepID=A0ABS4UTG0_9ACTN|nr:AraC family transcriptional regulator [Kribbella aluminosa]MBP2354834.1 AraC-like DNA-binding protein [Kribbella aluminosa]
MDVLSDLLQRAQATDALVRQIIASEPWSVTYADVPSLSVVATLGGNACLRLDDGVPRMLAAGDIALITGVGSYMIADDPETPPSYVIRGGRKHTAGGEPVEWREYLAPRTYGDGLPGATTMVRGAYDLRGGAGERVLALLPQLAVVSATPNTRPALDLLTTEIAREEPGQDAVLRRLLDFVLVLALRAWCAEVQLPSWYQALSAQGVGDALRLMHEDPARRWSVAELAAEAGLSRATFAARFSKLVGQPPLTYLTNWRMTLAADRLRTTTDTVATVAREVGYEDPFAFSVAFKRIYNQPPTTWRTA